MFRNDLLGCGNLFPASGQRLFGNRLQRIDVVKIDSIERVHIRSDIARHRDVDNEERSIDSVAQHRSKFLPREQREVGRCRCNQDIDFAALLRPLFEGNSAAIDCESEGFRALARAILTRKSPTPRETSARTVRSLVSPAPRTRTLQFRRSLKIFCARSTATEPTETAPRVISVRVRTCLAT